VATGISSLHRNAAHDSLAYCDRYLWVAELLKLGTAEVVDAQAVRMRGQGIGSLAALWVPLLLLRVPQAAACLCCNLLFNPSLLLHDWMALFRH
jgi:hypothetical protein